MTRRGFALACCLLMFPAPSLLAQSHEAKPDSLSGTWTGDLSPQGESAATVTFQLTFDGKNAVSGTFTGLPIPGDVKHGTFDPKTGALKLELGKQGEPDVLLVLEGTVANGIATGKFTGEMAGEFKLTKSDHHSGL